jgi:diacylglycerol kinase (ATP)
MQTKINQPSDTKSHKSSMSGKISSSSFTSKLERNPQHRTQAWQVATSIGLSFKYAAAGVTYAFNTQRNFRIHCIMGTLAITFGALLNLTGVEMAVICITSGLVLTLELLNTAIESVVDLTVQQTYHELAKIAKDCAAGAVLVSAFASVLVGFCLIAPKVMLFLSQRGF